MIDNGIQEILRATDQALQNSNLWELQILPSVSTPSSAPTTSSAINQFIDIKYRVQSVSLPFLGFETQTRKTGTKHYTNYIPEGEFSITFLENTNFDTFNFLDGWRNQIYDPIRRVFRANGSTQVKDMQLVFQKDTVVRLIGPLNTYYRHTTKGFHFRRTLLKTISNLDLNYTGNDPLIFTASFECDTISSVISDLIPIDKIQEQGLVSHFSNKKRVNI